MRQPPPFAQRTPHQSLYDIINPGTFPPPDGKKLYVTMGIRGQESRRRNMIIHQSGGATSGATREKGSVIDKTLEMHFRPIYDWSTQDVWLAIKEKGWDFNDAYNVMTRFGIKREQQRIAPVTMTVHGAPLLKMASRAWPEWFERLCHRLPGVKLASLYGKQALSPIRRPDETWKQAYQRLNIDDAPKWIAKRAAQYRDSVERQHGKHSTDDIQEIAACPTCVGLSWMKMTHDMYFGDPFLLNVNCPALGYLEPEDMRPGAGKFGGKPTF